jgi:hypothetical protein
MRKTVGDQSVGPEGRTISETPEKPATVDPAGFEPATLESTIPGHSEPRRANESVGGGGSANPEPVALPIVCEHEPLAHTLNGCFALGRLADGSPVCPCTPTIQPSREPLAQISLEDRLLVALAARGHWRIGQAICNATGMHAPPLFYISDEDLVLALEGAILPFSGSPQQ